MRGTKLKIALTTFTAGERRNQLDSRYKKVQPSQAELKERNFLQGLKHMDLESRNRR